MREEYYAIWTDAAGYVGGLSKSFKAAIHTVLDENDADGVIRRAKEKIQGNSQ